MEYKFCSSQEDVEKFLLTLKGILLDSKFDINKDLDILLKKKTEDSRKVFCISFHFAKFENKKFPYQGGESL